MTDPIHPPVQSPVQFGPDRDLMGMVTMPGKASAFPIGVLMLNMGANHRVGPRRINVKLAHALSMEGITSLRLDLGGVGDSGPGSEAADLRQRAVLDLQAAMDLFQTMLGFDRFVILGMCSGAEHAISAALADSRVIGISMFDGFNFPDLRARWERSLRRAWAAPFHPAFAGKALRLMSRVLRRYEGETPQAGFFTEERPGAVAIEWFRDAMNRLSEKDVSIHMLFSGSLNVADRDRDQLGIFRQEPFARKVHYQFMQEIDHTVCTTQGQQLFLKSVGGWVIDVAWKALEARPPRQGARSDADRRNEGARSHAFADAGRGPLQ